MIQVLPDRLGPVAARRPRRPGNRDRGPALMSGKFVLGVDYHACPPNPGLAQHWDVMLGRDSLALRPQAAAFKLPGAEPFGPARNTVRI